MVETILSFSYWRKRTKSRALGRKCWSRPKSYIRLVKTGLISKWIRLRAVFFTIVVALLFNLQFLIHSEICFYCCWLLLEWKIKKKKRKQQILKANKRCLDRKSLCCIHPKLTQPSYVTTKLKSNDLFGNCLWLNNSFYYDFCFSHFGFFFNFNFKVTRTHTYNQLYTFLWLMSVLVAHWSLQKC